MVENRSPFVVMSTSQEAEELRQPLMTTTPTAPSEPEVLTPDDTDIPVMDMSTDGNDADAAAPLEERRKMGAGIAGGVVGLLLGGPFVGALLGFGSAYATARDGAAGDAARALGDVALVASAKAKEVDEKHNLVEKTKVAANDVWEKAKELDRRHHILERSTEFVIWSWENIKEINRKHRLLERTIEGIGRGIGTLLKRISDRLNPRDVANEDDAMPDMTLFGSTTEASARVVPEEKYT